jgi:cytidine deaminase
MTSKQYQFSYQIYNSIEDLTPADAALLQQAREVAEKAYAPYSNFFVGAVAKLANGEVLTGTNQENASYPVTLCAERSLLATVAALHPNVPVETMAITYHNHNKNSDSSHPISPCGMCRQSLVEYEGRVNQPIRLILGGFEGKVFVVEEANALLPLSFTSKDLLGGE